MLLKTDEVELTCDTFNCENFNKESNILIAKFNASKIPEGCRACGGPYPSCKSSCNMFDD